MSESTGANESLLRMGWIVWLIGWVIFIASIFFALANKSSHPPYVIPFWTCFLALFVGSAGYFIARQVSDGWKSNTVRPFFSPYIIGSTVWLLLILLFVLLDRFAG
ncbi:MAG: hypothetical protein AB1813_03080 [Verrucomicrobiota bacterium]